MSSTRTISLLIALAFLPLAGFANAQIEPTDDCVGEPGYDIVVEGSTVACVFEPSIGDRCTGTDEPGIEVRTGNTPVACVPASEIARLTVSFHGSGDEAAGPDTTCDGEPADQSTYLTATVPPSADPQFDIDETTIAFTRCIQVTTGDGSTAAVPIPAAELPAASVRVTFHPGLFVPEPGPTGNGYCAEPEASYLQIDNVAGPTGVPAPADATCVQAVVTLEDETVLRVAAGLVALPPIGGPIYTDGGDDPSQATYIVVDTDGTPGQTEDDTIVRFLGADGEPRQIGSGEVACLGLDNAGELTAEGPITIPPDCALPEIAVPVHFRDDDGDVEDPTAFGWHTIVVDLGVVGITGMDPFVQLRRDGTPSTLENANQVAIGMGDETIQTVPPAVAVPGAGTIGYHAEFTFVPDLVENAFAFDGLNHVAITAELFDGAGAPLAFAEGANNCGAQLVLDGFAPGTTEPYVQLSACALFSTDQVDGNTATFDLFRQELVTSSMAPGTVWTLHVESPNAPSPVPAPDAPSLLVYPWQYAHYSVPAQAAFADAPDIADVLDAVPTPILATPKVVATITADPAFLASEDGGIGRFIVSLSPQQSGPTQVPFSADESEDGSAKRDGAGVANPDYKLRYNLGADILGNVITVPGGTSVVHVDVVPINDDRLEYAQTVTLVLAEGPQSAVGDSADATLSIADNEKPVVTLSGTPRPAPPAASTATDLEASEQGAERAFVLFTRTSPPAGESAVIPPLTIDFDRVGSTADVGGPDFDTLCMNPSIPTQVGPVGLPIPEEVPTSLPIDLSDCLRGQARSCPGPSAAACTTVASTLASALGDTSAIACTGELSTVCHATFGEGANTAGMVLLPMDDTRVEGPESLRVNLLAGTGYTASAVAELKAVTVNLLDNEILPTVELALNGVQTHEAGNPLRLTVSRTPTTLETKVYLRTGGEGDSSDYRFREQSGVTLTGEGLEVIIPAGETSKTVVIDGLQDLQPEPTESVTVELGSGLFKGNALKPATRLVTFSIVDDDPLPEVTIRAIDPTAGEDGDLATLLIERTGDLATDLTIAVAADNGDESDFSLSSDFVTIPAGSASGIITLEATDDALGENPESVRIVLVAESSFIVGSPASAEVRLVDDDRPALHLSVPDLDLAEDGATSALVRVHRTPVDLGKALTVAYVVTGTAASGTDYTALPGTVTIAAGQTFADIAVQALDDVTADANERLTISLSGGGNAYAVEAPSSANLIIVDNDLGPADDADGDGLLNAVDPCPLVSDPEPADLDGDGHGDACDDDQDGDGSKDAHELAFGTDPRDDDTDRDLVADGQEVKDGTDPLDPFSPDYRAKDIETSLEDDGMHVTWTAGDKRIGQFLVWRLSEPELVGIVNATSGSSYEIVDDEFPGGRHTYSVQTVLDGQPVAGYDANSTSASAPVFTPLCTAQPTDSDGDDLCDARETELGTDPQVGDSDGDGLSDGAETLGVYGDATDPLDADSDDDGVSDGDDLETASVGSSAVDLDSTWIVLAVVLAGAVLVLSLVGVVRFMRRT